MKTEIIGLGKDSIIYGVGSVVTRSIGIITLPLFTAYLAREEYGILAMLGLLSMVAQPVFSLGVSAAMGLCYFEKNDLKNKSQTVWGVFALNFLSSLVLVSLAWVFPEFWGTLVRLPSEYSYLVQLSLTCVALTILNNAFSHRVQFEKQATVYVAVTAVTALVSIIVCVHTVVNMNLGIVGMIYGQLAGNIFAFVTFLILGLKQTSIVFSWQIIKEILRHGLPLVPSFAFAFILMHANKYILEYYHGLDAVGVYSIGFNIGVTISIITGGIAKAWYPFFMSYMTKKEDAKVIFAHIVTYYFYAVGLLCSAYFIFAKPVVLFLADEKFHSSYMVVGFVSLAHFFQVLFNFFLPNLYFTKTVKYVSFIQGGAAFLSIPIFLILIKHYSIIGCALGICISNLLAAFLLYLWNSKMSNKCITIEYRWWHIIRVCGLFALMTCLYSCAPAMPLISEIIKSIIFWLTLIVFLFLILGKPEKEYLKNSSVALFKRFQNKLTA